MIALRFLVRSQIATVDEIETHGWSLNPGRYVGVADGGDDGFDFAERFGELSEEFQALSIQSTELAETVAQNASAILSAEVEPMS